MVHHLMSYCIAGNFLQGPNFQDFCDPRPKRENKNLKILNTWTFTWTFELTEIFTCLFCALVSLNVRMSLYHYFKPADNVLPSPTGDLSSFVSSAMIKGHGQYVAHTKCKLRKISSGGKTGFSWKFGSARISNNMVLDSSAEVEQSKQLALFPWKIQFPSGSYWKWVLNLYSRKKSVTVMPIWNCTVCFLHR